MICLTKVSQGELCSGRLSTELYRKTIHHLDSGDLRRVKQKKNHTKFLINIDNTCFLSYNNSRVEIWSALVF